MLICKPNGVVQLHSTAINLNEIKQIIMFQNDGDKINNFHNYSLRKLKSKEQECIKCNQSILKKIVAKSSEIKFLLPSQGSDKLKKKSLKNKDSADTTAANNSLSKTASVNDLHLPIQNENTPVDQIKFVSKKSLSGKKKKKKKKPVNLFAKSNQDDAEPETFP